MEPILASQTRHALDSTLKNPPHAILISAPMGSGKGFVANYLALRLLDIEPSKLQSHPYFMHITPEANTISIETVRGLKSFLQLRTTGSKDVRRVLLIESAEAMTIEAQNALLKVLEEPPKDTVLILTCTQPKALLPTIFSRLQHTPLLKPSKEEVVGYFAKQFSENEVTKAFYMSNGCIGLMQALLNEPDTHPLAKNIELAKNIFKKSVYERLNLINSLGMIDLHGLCAGLYSVAHAALIVAIEKEQESNIREWYQRCCTIHQTEQQLPHKPSPKLVLTNLFTNI